MTRKVLLVCGIVSSLLYVAMNVIGAMRWEEYSSTAQTISELSAIGAPTRPLWMVLGVVYTILVTAFGCGIWMSARHSRPLRIMGGLMVVYGLSGLAWPFAPMHQRAVLAASGGGTLTDTAHIVLGMATVLLMLVAMGFAATAFGTQFRFYSIVTMAVLLLFGVLTGLDAPEIGKNLPTPWVGVWERISLGAFLLWIVVLAVELLRDREGEVRDRRASLTPA